MIVGKDPEGLFSVDGCPLLSVDGCPLLSVDGCPLLSVDGCCEGLFTFVLSLVDEF